MSKINSTKTFKEPLTKPPEPQASSDDLTPEPERSQWYETQEKRDQIAEKHCEILRHQAMDHQRKPIE